MRRIVKKANKKRKENCRKKIYDIQELINHKRTEEGKFAAKLPLTMLISFFLAEMEVKRKFFTVRWARA